MLKGGFGMEPSNEALRLSGRQAAIKDAMRGPGGIRATAERELHEIRQPLTRSPGAGRAIRETSSRLRRPVYALAMGDIELP